MPTPTKFHDRCFADGYDHGLRGAPSGCSYYDVGTSAHAAYMDGWRDGWRARRALLRHSERAPTGCGRAELRALADAGAMPLREYLERVS